MVVWLGRCRWAVVLPRAGVLALGMLSVCAGAAPASPFAYVAVTQPSKVAQFNAAGGALQPLSPPTVSGGASANGIIVSPDGRSVYVSDFGNAGVSEFSVGAGGVLTAKTPNPILTGPSPEGLAETPDGHNVYVANSAKIYQYNVGAGGLLSPKTPATVSPGPSGTMAVAVSPDGKSVYVADGLQHIYQFDVGTGGQLVAKNPAFVTAGFNPYDVVVSPDGKSVYTANHGDGTVSEFDVGAGGVLTPKTTATIAAGTNPYGLAVTPDGHNVYAVNNGSATVSEFDVGTGGALSAHSPATIATGTGPRQVAITPDGHSLYLTNTGAVGGTVSQYEIASGTLSLRSPATVTVGLVPNGIAVGPAAIKDTTAPTASITSPSSGAQYAEGQTVAAAYSCADPDGASDVASCSGTVPVGHAIPTSSPGAKTFTVQATDRAGNHGSATVHYTVIARPAVSHVSESKRTWREGSKRATFSRSGASVGTTFSFVLNEQATVTLTFTELVPGARVSGKCVARNRSNRHKPRCVRDVASGKLSFRGHAGVDKVHFEGRVSASKKLPIGAYALTIVAKNSLGGRSKPETLHFTVVK